MEIKGKIELIGKTQQVTDSFKKREFIFEYAENPEYPEHLKIEFIQDKCDLLDKFKPGQTVALSINLRGRKWTDPQGKDKYFNTLLAWKINDCEQSNQPDSQWEGQNESDTPF